MKDRQTGSIWTHYDGSVLVGPLADSDIKLEVQPLVHTTWEEWLALYPDSLVPEWETPFTSRYREVTPGGGSIGAQFQRTILHTDDRLEDNELVLGAGVGEDFRAYPLADFDEGLTVISDELGGFPVVVFLDADASYGLAFSAVVDGTPLAFTVEDGDIVDNEGTVWDISGNATDGPRAGAELQYVTSFVTEWYGWVAYYPETSIYGES